jgi:hypothetical protein
LAFGTLVFAEKPVAAQRSSEKWGPGWARAPSALLFLHRGWDNEPESPAGKSKKACQLRLTTAREINKHKTGKLSSHEGKDFPRPYSDMWAELAVISRPLDT